KTTTKHKTSASLPSLSSSPSSPASPSHRRHCFFLGNRCLISYNIWLQTALSEQLFRTEKCKCKEHAKSPLLFSHLSLSLLPLPARSPPHRVSASVSVPAPVPELALVRLGGSADGRGGGCGARVACRPLLRRPAAFPGLRLCDYSAFPLHCRFSFP